MGTNEIAIQDEHCTDLSLLPPAQPSQQTQTAIARQVLRDHAELSQMAWEFATKLCSTKMVPVRYRNAPEEGTAAILYGAELGLGPISALQNIFEVHGSPGIYARTAQALLEAKGFQFRTIESDNEVATIHGWKPGRDVKTDEPDEWSTFTYEDAERAGWAPTPLNAERGGLLIRGIRYEANQYGKLAGNEKYLTQPRQMLWAKAMMETCRHLSPATLLGIAYSVEELESEHSSPNPIGGSPASPAGDAPLTVDEILSAEPGRETAAEDRVKAAAAEIVGAVQDDGGELVDPVEPEPAPAKAPAKAPGKRSAAKEQREAAAKQKADLKAATKKLPKDAADRVAAALEHAKAAHDGGNGEEGPQTPETTPAADPEPQDDPADTPEVTPDPSEPEPTGDNQGYWPDGDLGDDPDRDNTSDPYDDARDAEPPQPEPEPEPEPVKAPANWDGAKPATAEQLKELAGCIAAAGYQPTQQGRAEWFAWLSQEVGRDITANNKLSRAEIDSVIATMKAD